MIYIYVDFVPILSTASSDDAVGLLIAMYSIFELSFDKKSRTIRFLYCVLHGDKQFLSNSIRVLIKEKNIEIHQERLRQLPAPSNSISNNETALVSESQVQLQTVTNMLDHSTGQHISSSIYQTAEPTNSNDNSHSCVQLAHDNTEWVTPIKLFHFLDHFFVKQIQQNTWKHVIISWWFSTSHKEETKAFTRFKWRRTEWWTTEPCSTRKRWMFS